MWGILDISVVFPEHFDVFKSTTSQQHGYNTRNGYMPVISTGMLRDGLVSILSAPLKPQQRLYIATYHLLPKCQHQLALAPHWLSIWKGWIGLCDLLYRPSWHCRRIPLSPTSTLLWLRGVWGPSPRAHSKCLSSCFNTRASVHGRTTRSQDKLDIPEFNTAAVQRSFIYQAVKCWNTTPEEIT